MAVIRRIEAQRSFDIGGIPSTQVDDSVGQGLRAVGGAIQNAGEAMHAMEMRRLAMDKQIEEFESQQGFNRWQDDNSLEFAKAEEGIAASGKGFTETVSKVFTDRSEEFLKNVPDSLRPKFNELVATARNQWVNQGIAKEIDQRNNWYRTTLTDRAQILENQAFDNPGNFDAIQQSMAREIDASGLPPSEKNEWRQKTANLFSMATLKRQIADDPEGAMQSIGIVRTRNGDQRKANYLDVAQSFIGATEGNDSKAISEFIKRSAGINIDPKQTAWCAAFVNAVLGSQNLGGTGSLAARSFLQYGTETNEPKVGDVVVLTRGC